MKKNYHPFALLSSSFSSYALIFLSRLAMVFFGQGLEEFGVAMVAVGMERERLWCLPVSCNLATCFACKTPVFCFFSCSALAHL